MIFSNRKQRRRTILITCLLVAASVFTIWGFSQGQIPAGHPRRKLEGVAFRRGQFELETGSEQAARKYYREVVSPQLQFLTPNSIEDSSIKELLDYFGYNNITAKDLHRLSSEQLMQLAAADQILATRFFAPKITNVAEPPVAVPAGGFGWRKLVSLKAQSGSKAANNGQETLLFLQNIFERTVAGNPFDADKNVSQFNQVIVVRKQGPFNNATQPIYFLTYGSLVKLDQQGVPLKDGNGNFQDEGKLIFSLKATFDNRDPETNLTPKEYFVPDSCVQCHGGSRARGKANYLDTDHWFDRVTPNYGLAGARYKQEDFTALADSEHGVLFDGGKDQTTEKFRQAFAIIRKLNESISEQNSRLGTTDNFQLGAVNRWLELHPANPSGAKHVPPYERGYGSQKWEANNELHRKLLYEFNRYCYRCHSSVRFNVFDLAAVKGRAGVIPGRVVEIEAPAIWMPQDRIFPGLKVGADGLGEATGDLKTFLDLLAQLQPQ